MENIFLSKFLLYLSVINTYQINISIGELLIKALVNCFP